jgi:protein-disulfide isomerase
VSGNYRPPRLTLPVGERDHAQGGTDAHLVLVEYGDYQCPYCGAAYPIVKRVQKEFGAGLKFVFRNFPITNLHPRAEWAAETAEAAAAQGKFWEMHDYLFENQKSLDDESLFSRHAAALKLDAPRIAREVEKGAYASRIQEDYTSGIRSGVNGTPTFFIDGTRYDGYPEFGPIVSALSEAQKASKRKG